MPPVTREELESLAHELRVCVALARELTAAAGRVLARLEGGLESPVQTAAAAHVAAHVTGTPSRIAADPELEAFLVARIHHRTFPQLAADVKAAFPPERHVSQSAIWRWWQRRKRVRP